MAYYLGIDGGGSKTTCAVGDEFELLATATSGPSNITRVGEARARASLHQAIHEACTSAKIDPRKIRRACIGVAGASRPEIAKTISTIVAELLPGETDVLGDMLIALHAALGSGPGVIVIAGTGSIAYGRNAQGKTTRAGGWGFAVSDEGSAHWIGRTAVAQFLRALDSRVLHESIAKEDFGDASALWRELKVAWNLHSKNDLVRVANSHPDFAALFPAIVKAAQAEADLDAQGGHPPAQSVLADAGRELAKLAAIVLRGTFPATDSPAIPLAMAGGVFRHCKKVREVFREAVQKLVPGVALSSEVVEPVAGALQMARSGISSPSHAAP